MTTPAASGFTEGAYAHLPKRTEQRHTVDTITSDALDALYAQLDALKTISDGYCPHCGRGDCSPTADQWYEQHQRADRAEAELQRLRTESPWLRATAEDLATAQAAIARVRAVQTDWLSTGAPPIGTSIARWWDKRLIELAAALDEPKEPTT